MGKISAWFDKLFQKLALKNFLAQAAWVDGGTLAAFLVGIVIGARNGFLRQSAIFLETCVVVALVLGIQGHLSEALAPVLPFMPKETTAFLVFWLLAILISFLMFLLDKQLQKLIHTKLVGWIRIPGGMLIGALNLLLIWSLISQAIVQLPSRGLRRVYESGNSHSGVFIQNFAPHVYNLLTAPFPMLRKHH